MSQTPDRRTVLAMGLAGAAFPVGLARAETWPDHPVTLLVGFAAGGGVDIVARAIGAELQARLGQPVVIENRPGANSNVAAIAAARARPDGYTLLVGANGMTTNGALYPGTAFDVEKDFEMVSSIGASPPVIAAGKGFAGNSLADLVRLAKADPDGLVFGSPGAGSSAHLAMVLFERVAGIKLRHVAYRGGQPAITDALGGHIPLLAVNLPEVLGQVAAGDLKILGVPSLKRQALVPDAPTVAEQGYPGFEAATWWAIFAPAGTPRAIVERVSTETRAACATPAFQERMRAVGAVATGSTPEEMASFIHAERERWTKIIVEAKITAE